MYMIIILVYITINKIANKIIILQIDIEKFCEYNIHQAGCENKLFWMWNARETDAEKLCEHSSHRAGWEYKTPHIAQ